MPEPEDKDLLQRLKEGQEQAFVEIYHLYHKRLFSFAIKYLKSRELAQDAVQAAFIKLWENRQKIESSVRGFLFTTARNHILNMIRNDHLRILKKVQLEQQKVMPRNETEEVILYSEYQRILNEGLAELPPGKREIFELKTTGGLTNPEIAEKLGISINTVKSQFYEASRFIREYLARHANIRHGS